MKILPFAVPSIVVVASLAAPLQVRASGARDPFHPYLLSAPIVLAASPLTRYSVDDLHVEGIVSGNAAPRALVDAPDGEVVEVGVGSLIGNRGGHVDAISKDAIVVVEKIDDQNDHEIILGLSPSE